MNTTGSRVLDELIRMIGEESALALAREFGGTQITLVRGETRSSAITRSRVAEVIGEPAYETLLREIGVGAVLSVPMGKTLLRIRDVAECHRLIDAGLTTNEIALRLNRSYRWVERVGKEPTASHQAAQGHQIAQGNLF